MAQLPDPFEARHHTVAEALAIGRTVKAAAAEGDVSESTVLRWKRDRRFQELVESYTPQSQVERAISERQQNFDLLQEARDAEILLTVELRDSLERVIEIVKKRLDSMSENEIDGLAIRHISPLLKLVLDGLPALQHSHDRLTGYGMLIKQLEQIIEQNGGKA